MVRSPGSLRQYTGCHCRNAGHDYDTFPERASVPSHRIITNLNILSVFPSLNSYSVRDICYLLVDITGGYPLSQDTQKVRSRLEISMADEEGTAQTNWFEVGSSIAYLAVCGIAILFGLCSCAYFCVDRWLIKRRRISKARKAAENRKWPARPHRGSGLNNISVPSPRRSTYS